VLNKTATMKHFDTFKHIVKSLNNDNFDFINGSNYSIYADNSKLIEGQKETNSHLAKIASKPEPYFKNGKIVGTIEGNRTLIINE